ncbi:amidohydrolase family protein [Segnochrobactraceae bacterium EtOH-i3]
MTADRPTGNRYAHLLGGCLCHSPAAQTVNRRLSTDLSRRALLGGLAGALTLAALPAPVHAAAPAETRPLRFTNVRIFDGLRDNLLDGRDVLVTGDRIAALPTRDEAIDDARVIDCGGRVLMPGLIDVHWHTILCAVPLAAAMTADIAYLHLLAAEEAGRTLQRGFTTVRDVGGPAFALKRTIDEGRLPGPRIFPSGAMISQTSGHGDFRFRTEVPRSAFNSLSTSEAAGISAIADGVPEMLRRVREQLMLGASQIKIMVGGGVASSYDPIGSLQFTPDEIRAAVAAAGDWGTYVAAHVYTSAGIIRALEAGVRSIEHGQLADRETARRIADAGATWSIQPFLADEDANIYADPVQRADQKKIADGTVAAFGFLRDFRIPMGWGTDVLFNPKGTKTQGRQLTKMARWFSPAEVLKMATSGNARVLALSGDRSPYPAPLGVIQPGAHADLLVVNGNPLTDLDLIATPETGLSLILKAGRVEKTLLG